jgi:hypothetical protein
MVVDVKHMKQLSEYVRWFKALVDEDENQLNDEGLEHLAYSLNCFTWLTPTRRTSYG